ncbi:Hypothetical protein RMHFA_01747 [Roseomonas mucosa]|jgi:hypothetical protein|uniref:Uncharacterized protein n=1 Tax=Roseomonas mucosa TaxID=207340 RepID=A0A379N3W6_9PROT|nr:MULTISPECIES: hypothetical protein [Roseomonas]AWV22620.1 hypothetical protein RADP37_01747 [Roseomonas mucosa]MCG7350358.1 hypothetical protein [Roseomonas mucosa]MDU7522601.1 hypothetical protein [Roseomonas mucosa]QDD94738.1 hypothetical protein HVIM_01747 [Roseomonas mucosa]QDD99847.1 hypothetical protein ADP8_01747 [Roseomonas mucosa]
MPPGTGGGLGIAGKRDDQDQRADGPEGESQPAPSPEPPEFSEGRLRKGLAWAAVIGVVWWLVVIVLVIELGGGWC